MREEITQTRDQGWQSYAEAVTLAPDLATSEEYDKLKSKTSKSFGELLKLRKYQIKQRFGQVSPELVKRDDQGWYPQLRLHYFLTSGNSYLKPRDRKAAEFVFYERKLWIPDLNLSQLGVRVGIYKFLGIDRLLDPSRAFRGTDEDLLRLLDVALNQAWEIKAGARISVHPQEKPIPLLKKFLAPLGLTLACEGRDRNAEGKPNAGTRYYRLVGLADGREEIFQFWLQRDAEQQTNLGALSPEKVPSQPPGVDPLPVSLNMYNHNGSEKPALTIEPGMWVRWGHTLGTWVVKAVEGTKAQIQRFSGAGTTVPLLDLEVVGSD